MKKLSFATLFLLAIAFLSSCEKEQVNYDTYYQIRNISEYDYDSILMKFESNFVYNNTACFYDVNTNEITDFKRCTNVENNFNIIAWKDNQQYLKFWFGPSRIIDPVDPSVNFTLPGYYTFTIISANDSTGEIDLGLTNYSSKHPY